MFSIARHSLSLTSKPLPYRVSARKTAVRLNRKYHAKVSALPFAFSGNDAIRHVAPWVSAGTMGQGLVKSLLAKYLPGFGSEPMQPEDLRAVYVPVWFVDGEVTGTVKNPSAEESLTIQSLNSYMPGFSFDPLSTLSFSQPDLEKISVPFTPELRHQHGLDVSCLPYSISPASLPEVVKSLNFSQSKFQDSVTFDRGSVDFSMLAAYPVLLPVYMMRYDWKVPTVPDRVALTCIIQAHSKDGLAYFDNATKETGNIFRKALGTLEIPPGSWMDKLMHTADDVQTWELIHGTSFGFSSIGVQGTPPGSSPTIKALSNSIDEKIQTKSNMDVLAKYGVDMDHPCVRVFAKEEVDANRKYLVASGKRYTLHRFIRGLSAREIKMNTQPNGKRVVRSEAVQEVLKERTKVLENQSDELKPQWVQDWQDSRQGPSGPP